MPYFKIRDLCGPLLRHTHHADGFQAASAQEERLRRDWRVSTAFIHREHIRSDKKKLVVVVTRGVDAERASVAWSIARFEAHLEYCRSCYSRAEPEKELNRRTGSQAGARCPRPCASGCVMCSMICSGQA